MRSHSEVLSRHRFWGNISQPITIIENSVAFMYILTLNIWKIKFRKPFIITIKDTFSSSYVSPMYKHTTRCWEKLKKT